MASAPVLRGRGRRLELHCPRIMGILNVTPDSFSDGGRFNSLENALRRAAEMVAEGADLIDIGGESSRPGSLPVSLDEELARVVPVVEKLASHLDVAISVDTTKAEVARQALLAGASFVNDISGLRFDPAMVRVVAESGAGLFIMHTRGPSASMQRHTDYADVLGEIKAYLREGIALARGAGVAEDCLAVDPGIGFGKSVEGNLEILARLGELRDLGRPILLGTSRKNFIGVVTGQQDPAARLAGTLATVALGVAAGASIFRVHDVRPAREAALMAFAVSHRPPSF